MGGDLSFWGVAEGVTSQQPEDLRNPSIQGKIKGGRGLETGRVSLPEVVQDFGDCNPSIERRLKMSGASGI